MRNVLGKVSLRGRGNYAATSLYEQLDVVNYGGITYFAITDVPAGTPPTNTDYWQLLAEKGPQGSRGQTGPRGNGIANIAKTATAGKVDTYTITFDDGSTTTYNITNGADGREFKVAGAFDTLAELEAAHPTGNDKAYLVRDDENVYVWSEDDEEWTALGELLGPAGPQGPQGPQGQPGPVGPPGSIDTSVGEITIAPTAWEELGPRFRAVVALAGLTESSYLIYDCVDMTTVEEMQNNVILGMYYSDGYVVFVADTKPTVTLKFKYIKLS